MKFDGHEVAVLSSITGFYSIVNNCLGPGWIRGFIHRMPIAAFSVALGGVGLILPFTVVPIRRALKLPTNQYDPLHPKAVFPTYADITEWKRLQGE
jgi:hypothetical protein